MNRDFIAGLVGLLFAIAYYAMATQIQASQLADEVGPAGLPKIYAVLLGGFSALLMVRALLRPAVVDGKARPVSEELFAVRRALGLWFVFVFLLHIGQPAGIWPDVIQGMRR